MSCCKYWVSNNQFFNTQFYIFITMYIRAIFYLLKITIHFCGYYISAFKRHSYSWLNIYANDAVKFLNLGSRTFNTYVDIVIFKRIKEQKTNLRCIHLVKNPGIWVRTITFWTVKFYSSIYEKGALIGKYTKEINNRS